MIGRATQRQANDEHRHFATIRAKSWGEKKRKSIKEQRKRKYGFYFQVDVNRSRYERFQGILKKKSNFSLSFQKQRISKWKHTLSPPRINNETTYLPACLCLFNLLLYWSIKTLTDNAVFDCYKKIKSNQIKHNIFKIIILRVESRPYKRHDRRYRKPNRTMPKTRNFACQKNKNKKSEFHDIFFVLKTCPSNGDSYNYK